MCLSCVRCSRYRELPAGDAALLLVFGGRTASPRQQQRRKKPLTGVGKAGVSAPPAASRHRKLLQSVSLK
ncbi:hypothetical protein SKAU_G00332610 [Synaphobranchus kaupii]|uniref:Uncharacterized protein n=1 Tax=Synaphobranchus kaupii TaxID=118154 RepID=A0A9Q1ELE6_SYNKA|nr:hypothetical protein SKAU_G00332610 [Synaphobranchus kaupii]